MRKGNAQLTSRETLSFATPTPPVLDVRSTSSAHRPLYEGVHVHPWVSPDLDGDLIIRIGPRQEARRLPWPFIGLATPSLAGQMTPEVVACLNGWRSAAMPVAAAMRPRGRCCSAGVR